MKTVKPGGKLGEFLCWLGWHRWGPYSRTPIADGWMEKCERCGLPRGKVHYG